MPREDQILTRDLGAEQQALSDLLRQPSEGGAAVGGGSLGAGADVPSVLSANPATEQLVQEQINSRVYGTGTPNFGTPDTGAIATGDEVRAPAPDAADAPAFQGEIVDGTTSRSDSLLADIEARFPEFETKTKDQLIKEEEARIQDQVDAINRVFDVRIGSERKAGEERAGQTRALGALGGTQFGAFGQAQQAKTASLNEEAIQAIEAERANSIAALFSEAAKRAGEDFRAQSALALDAATASVTALSDAYNLAADEEQALRDEAYRRAVLTGLTEEGGETLALQEFLLDTNNSLADNARADASLDLQRRQLELSGISTQVMPDGTLLAIDNSTFPPTTSVVGNYAKPIVLSSGSSLVNNNNTAANLLDINAPESFSSAEEGITFAQENLGNIYHNSLINSGATPSSPTNTNKSDTDAPTARELLAG